MSQDPMRTLGIAGAVAMVGLNITVLAFFVLWSIADSAAIGRMESESNMDPGQMLPNSELMWLAAHGSVLMVVVLDVLAVAGLVKMTGVLQRNARRNITPIGYVNRLAQQDPGNNARIRLEKFKSVGRK